MPDRTRDPIKRRATVAACVRRYRAPKRAAKEALAHAKRQAATAARREATRLKVAAWRARKAAEAEALEAVVRGSWFEPELTDAEFQAYAAENGWDYVTTKERKESFERACRIASINLNKFVLVHYVNAAVVRRVIFHELVESGLTVLQAVQATPTGKFVPTGQPGSVERELNMQARFAAAKETWGDGAEIINALKGQRSNSDE